MHLHYQVDRGVTRIKNKVKQFSNRTIAGSVIGVSAFGLALMPLASAATPQVVTESDVTRQAEDTEPTNNWVVYTRAGTPPTAAVFQDGPATPPEGTGSLQLTTATSSEKVYAFNYDHVGTKLSDVNTISYSTYRSAGNLQQVAALNVQIDTNGTEVAGGFSTLVFEPVYNTNQGAVVSGEWQDWNAGNESIWWSSNPIAGAPNRDTFVTLQSIKDANPDAVVLGVGVNQGSGNPGLTTAVDAFTFDDVTYDFEAPLPVQPSSKDECKDGGWMNFQTQYKNQGQCVASVVSNANSKHNRE
jgi:hypothetical protein